MIYQSELPHWVGKPLPKSDPPCHDFYLCTWYDDISSNLFHSSCHDYPYTDCRKNLQVCICDQTPPSWYNYFCRYLYCCLSYMCRSRSCRDYCNYLRLCNFYMIFDYITKFKSFLRSKSNILISSSSRGCSCSLSLKRLFFCFFIAPLFTWSWLILLIINDYFHRSKILLWSTCHCFSYPDCQYGIVNLLI
jgi:hypothetical protein